MTEPDQTTVVVASNAWSCWQPAPARPGQHRARASRSLADGPPGLDVPVDVQIRSVTDLTTRREADDVDIAVWGGQPSPSGKLLIPVCHVLFS